MRRLKGSSPRHLRGILIYAINATLDGSISPEQAHAVAKLASTLLKVFEATQMEDRLKELENRLGIPQRPKLIKSDINGMVKELSK